MAELYGIAETDITDELRTVKKLYACKLSSDVETNSLQTIRDFKELLTSYKDPLHFMHELCIIGVSLSVRSAGVRKRVELCQ